MKMKFRKGDIVKFNFYHNFRERYMVEGVVVDIDEVRKIIWVGSKSLDRYHQWYGPGHYSVIGFREDELEHVS